MRRIVDITGIQVDDLNYEETLAAITSAIEARSCQRMVVVNASKIVLAHANPTLLEIIAHSSIVTADGMSVVWAAKLLGYNLRERVTGIDTMDRLVEMAAQKGFSVYFLGAKDNVVEMVVHLYQQKFPGLRVAGYHHGYFDPHSDAMAQAVRAAKPDILFVAMGSPVQEQWIDRFQATTGAPFCLGVGGSFDHIGGFSRRAPVWMQNVGLEWLYRMASEPRRLWRRYFFGNSRFMALVLRQRFNLGPTKKNDVRDG